MTRYLETFAIPFLGEIGIDDENKAWLNGKPMLIKPDTTRTEVRAGLSKYVDSHLRGLRGAANDRLLHLNMAIGKIQESDVGIGVFVARPTLLHEEDCTNANQPDPAATAR